MVEDEQDSDYSSPLKGQALKEFVAKACSSEQGIGMVAIFNWNMLLKWDFMTLAT